MGINSRFLKSDWYICWCACIIFPIYFRLFQQEEIESAGKYLGRAMPGTKTKKVSVREAARMGQGVVTGGTTAAAVAVPVGESIASPIPPPESLQILEEF